MLSCSHKCTINVKQHLGNMVALRAALMGTASTLLSHHTLLRDEMRQSEKKYEPKFLGSYRASVTDLSSTPHKSLHQRCYLLRSVTRLYRCMGATAT